jgi:zinc transport system substrate-binding protein
MPLRIVLLCLCCLLPASATATAELRVFVTVAPLAWLVEALGGSHVRVFSLVKPGQDPHSFEPSPGQLSGLRDADAYLSLGLPFERAWLPRMAAQHPQLRLVELVEDSAAPAQTPAHHPAEHHHRHSDHPAGVDPHIWTDPLGMAQLSRRVSELLGDLRPAAAEEFRRRQHDVALQLRELHDDLTATFAAMPRKVFLVHHPAWGHLAARYGLTQLAIERDGKEPGPRALATLAEQVRLQRIRTLFVEPQISDHLAHGLADTLGLEIAVLDPLAADYPHNMRRVAQRIAGAVQ